MSSARRGSVCTRHASAAVSSRPIANGVSLCSIHHRAFDEDLVGISPDDDVHVSRRLLEEEDGPMLGLLKGFHRRPIKAPKRPAWRPNRERLAERFERFLAAT